MLLAVSGGPDSTALMGLSAACAAQDPAWPPLSVATVDHGLRAAARAEAEAAAAAAAGLGLSAHILAWDGPKPATRLQERAREQRYALLAACARRIGATHLVTAHTLDDQAETVLFRLAARLGAGRPRRHGAARRAGRARAPAPLPVRAQGPARRDLPGPRLALRRGSLNADPRFARTRLRRLMPALAAEGLDAARFAALARRMAETEEALAAAARRALAEAARGPGLYDAGRLLAEPAAVRHRWLALLVAEAGAAAGRPRRDAVERLAEALAQAAADGRPLRRTLHGAMVTFEARHGLSVAAAPPRRPGPRRPPA